MSNYVSRQSSPVELEYSKPPGVNSQSRNEGYDN